jgi:dihydropyrimidinase
MAGTATEFDLVIRNARCATAADVFDADIGVKDGRIVALGKALSAGTREIDAEGRYVLPGGVDGHCHIDQPMMDGSTMADDFWTGTRSAACGGNTTVIPFASQLKGQGLVDAMTESHRRAEGKAAVDYAFHLIICEPTDHALKKELPQVMREGCTSFKVYMTYDDLKLNDRQMLDVLAAARHEGAMIMMHAENTDCIAWLTERLIAAGHTAPKFHAAARPMLVEREATHRAIALAELVDVPILIVHVSGREAIEQIRWGQAQGLKIYAETCPQYLFLTADDMDDHAGHMHGAKCICSPPPRDKANQQVVWDALQGGVFEVFSSDHAPFRFAGEGGKLGAGPNASFDKIPNGVPGIETRLPLLFSAGVLEGRLDICEFVALTSTNVAKMYGLYPRKGSIAIGADADLVIWDTDVDIEIRNENLHHNVDYTPYEGQRVKAWPRMTLLRGEVVAEGGKFVGAAGQGEYLPCDLPKPAKPRVRRD